MARRKVGCIRWLDDDTCRITVRRGKSPDGGRRVADAVFHGLTQGEAEAKAVMMAQELGRTDAYDATMTLSEYYWGIFRDKPSNRGKPRTKGTLRWYDGAMSRDVLPTLGDRPLSELSHLEVRLCVQAAASPSNAKRALRAVLRSAYDDELMPEKPMERRIPTPRARSEQREPWNRFEASQALAAMPQAPADVEAYCILGLSGLGKEEALGVRPCDVREQSTYSFATGEEVRTVTVTVSHVYTDEDGLREGAKNDFRVRTVPVVVAGRERLMALLRQSRSEAAESGSLEGWAERRIIPYGAQGFSGRWERWLPRLGLRYIPPNMLRHTSDTLNLAAGVESDLNDRMHGRNQHSSTYQSYLRPDLGLMEEASQRAARLIANE